MGRSGEGRPLVPNAQIILFVLENKSISASVQMQRIANFKEHFS